MIALYVISIIVSAVIPSTVTGFQNTSSIGGRTCANVTGDNPGAGFDSCYNAQWGSSAQTGYLSIGSIEVVAVVVIFIVILISVLNML